MIAGAWRYGLVVVTSARLSKALARDPSRLGAAFLVTVAGLIGFVGLLVASAYLPREADALRIAALVWFVVLGAVRTTLILRTKPFEQN
jgi:NhaP-type Na+/H+ or K+/H+ antiporter